MEKLLILIYLVTTVFVLADCKQRKSQEIRFHKNDDVRVQKSYEFVTGTDVNIILENYDATHLKCITLLNDERSSTVVDISLNREVINNVTVHVTNKMEFNWRCIIDYYESPHSDNTKQKVYDFFVSIVGPHIFINDVLVASELQDGIKKNMHQFSKNQLVDYTCMMQLSDGPSLQLIYYSPNGTKLIEMERNNYYIHKFKAIMSPENHNSYVDCIYDDEFIYRTYFSYAPQETGDITVTINDIKLEPVVNTNSYGYDQYYHYTYYEGENLTISCDRSSEGVTGSVKLRFTDHDTNKVIESPDRPSKQSVVLTNLHRKSYSKTIICSLTDDNSYKSVEILLRIEDTPESVNIVGLAKDRIKYRYSHSNKIWYKDYWYFVGETITPTCYTRTGFTTLLALSFEGNNYEEAYDKRVSGIFTLNASHNMLQLKCESKLNGYSVVILLHQKPEPAPAAISSNDHSNSEVGSYRTNALHVPPKIVIKTNSPKNIGTYAVMNGNNLTIAFEDFNATQIKCGETYGRPVVDIRLNGDMNASVNVVITNKMAGNWQCTILHQRPNFNEISSNVYKFKIHVFGLKIDIGDIYDITSSNVLKKIDYHFVEGELLVVRCYKTSIFDETALRLTYYSKNNTKLLDSLPIYLQEATFKTVMHAENNGSYLDCIYDTEYDNIYRINFHRKDQVADNAKLILTVNGLKLVPISATDNGLRYKFMESEKITVSCENTANDMKGTLELNFVDQYLLGNTSVVRDGTAQKQTIQFTANSSTINYNTIRCKLTDDDGSKFETDVSFYQNNVDKLTVVGLPLNNIKYAYTHGSHKQYIHYWYSVGETLNLLCSIQTYFKDSVHLKWTFEEQDFEDNSYDKTTEIKYLPGSFALKSTHNMAKLICTAADRFKNRSVVIILHQKPELLGRSSEGATGTI